MEKHLTKQDLLRQLDGLLVQLQEAKMKRAEVDGLIHSIDGAIQFCEGLLAQWADLPDPEPSEPIPASVPETYQPGPLDPSAF